jgi:sodium/potassium-transporting ATPase subunit alpha
MSSAHEPIGSVPISMPPVPKKRDSLLQRLKIAPLDLVSAGSALRDPGDVPPRSPVGHVIREMSGLVQRKVSMPRVQEEASADPAMWHKMSVDDILTTLKASLSGLSIEVAQKRLVEVGPNKLTEPPRESLLIKFAKNCIQGFSVMLLGACALAVIIFVIELLNEKFFDVQTLALAVSLPIVVVITSLFATYQEGQSSNIMRELMLMTSEESYVLRDGRVMRVPSADIVPGDIVHIKGGEKVPADMRVLQCEDLKVNNAMLTGENIDVKVSKEPRHEVLFEARNIVRAGCSFTSGSGVGLVFATGDNTFLGRVANATNEASPPDTLLKREVRRIILCMCLIAVGLSALVLGLSFGRGDPWATAIVYVVGIVIANVPEGLLPQITLGLTLTAKRMLKRGVLATNLEIIETLGAVTVICSDKTGTITCNRMTVSHLYFGERIFRTEWAPESNDATPFVESNDTAAFHALRTCATLNSDAMFLSCNNDIQKRETRGDASEVALIKFFHPFGDIQATREHSPRTTCIPFNSTNKYMISVNKVTGCASTHKIFIKGAPERVLPLCAARFLDVSNNTLIPMDQEQRDMLDSVVLGLASKGGRVLAFAELLYDVPVDYSNDSDEHVFPTNGFNFLGLVSLMDPPRLSVRPALELCKSASIRVLMVTGDHPATAVSICQSLGYTGVPCGVLERGDVTDPNNTFCVVHGLNDIPRMSHEDWDFVFQCKEAVFARTMPEQKQDIVKYLAAQGNVVAMTGDGVNDAAALKTAHVGIAMGTGSAVAREASQVVLLDDDFGAIVEGIREGRLLFENLKKCAAYILTHLVPEVLPFLVTIIAGLPLGMQTLVVLFIDLGTEMAAGVTLAYEAPEDDIMSKPPRAPTEHLVNPRMMLVTYCSVGILETFVCYWAFLWVFYDHGFVLSQLWGTSSDWTSGAADLDQAAQQNYFEMCLQNSVFTGNCSDTDAFAQFRTVTLAKAQAAYFLQLVWCQLANILARRTQINSGVSWQRIRSNPYMLAAMLASICIGIGTVYIPGLNSIVQFAPHPEAKYLFTACWVLPLFVGAEELKKYWIRRDLPHHNSAHWIFVY